MENTNQSTTCKAAGNGSSMTNSATTKALIPIMKAVKAVGTTSSIEQRIAPTSNHNKVGLNPKGWIGSCMSKGESNNPAKNQIVIKLNPCLISR